MAQRLKNILQFTVGPGATVVLPHLLQDANGRPLVPDYVDPELKGLNVTADAINVSVTNTTGAAVITSILCESWHTVERAFGAVQTVALTPQPFVSGSAAPGTTPAPAITFIFRPGGTAGGNVYTTWPSLVTALTAVQGFKIIQFDDDIISPITIPPGVYSMLDTTWSGNLLGPTQVQVDEGTSFTFLRQFTDDVRVTFAGMTAPVSDFNSGLGSPDIVILDRGAKITTSGAGPFFSNSTIGGNGAGVILRLGGELQTGTTPVWHGAVAGSLSFISLADAFAVLQGDTVSGVVGSILIFAITASGVSLFDESQPQFLGTILNQNTTRSRTYSTDVHISDTFIFETNQVVRVDPTGGAINITFLPAFNSRGTSLFVKNVSASANAINVLPSGGDTIDGGASAAITAARGALHFISDGVSDWMIV